MPHVLPTHGDDAVLDGDGLDESYLIEDTNSSGVVFNPRSGMRQPSPTLPRKTLTFPYATPPMAINATYAGSLLFPDAVTLAVYGGAGNTGTDPFIVLDHVLPIYVSRTPNIDPTNATTYAFKTTSGSVLFADVRAYFDKSTDAKTADGRRLYYLVQNNSGGAINPLGVIWQDYELFQINPVEPGITTQPAVWPVMRDTDDYPLFSGIDPYRYTTTHLLAPIANGATGQSTSSSFNSQTGGPPIKDLQFAVSPAMPVYISLTGPPNTSAPGPDVLVKLGGIVTLADLQGKYGDAGITSSFCLACVNNTGNTATPIFTLKFELTINGRFQQMPVFFASKGVELDPIGQINGICENFSSTVYDSGFAGLPPPIPQRGYMIYSVLVRRQPKLARAAMAKHRSIYLPPTAVADLQALDVKVGFFAGLTHTSFDAIDKGTFNSLVTVTIPEGELEARVAVAWPVLYGTLLVYQADDPVFVEALVNFQPIFHNKQFGGGFLANHTDADNNLINDADPSAAYLVPACRYQNYFQKEYAQWPETDPYYVQFPMAAVIINDLIAALNLL
jgi:hypothetical protein